MKKLIIFALAMLPFASNADDSYLQQHKQQKQKLFASLDYCSSIASKEIFNLGTQDLTLIKENLESINKNFAEYKQQKDNCFDNSAILLDDIISNNMIFLQNNDNNEFERQNKLDIDLTEIIRLRKQLNSNLLDSILADINQTIKNKNAEFIQESAKTKRLLNQELNIIYKSILDQLILDQDNLNNQEQISLTQIADVSLRFAFLKLNQALSMFENIDNEEKAYNIAKIRTNVDTAYNKLLEMKAFSNNLDELDSKVQINKIINQLAIISVDLDVAIKSLTNNDFSEDYLTWAGQIYQQLSEQSNQIQQVLDTIYLIDITNQETSEPVAENSKQDTKQ